MLLKAVYGPTERRSMNELQESAGLNSFTKS
jgi:hypothetical protein